MKKWIYTLSLMGALAVGANAEAIEHHTPQLVDGCYQITNAGELFGFADIVNGIRNAENPEEYSQAPQPGVCGKLVADIRVVAVDSPSDKGNHVVSDDLKNANVPEENHWTPMVNFSGTFDGQGHSISGLYYSGNNAGFFASLSGATIKRLNIKDSYFAADDNVGGFAANATGNVTIEECSFEGLVTSVTKSDKPSNLQPYRGVAAAGFVGNLVSPAELAIKMSTFNGSVLPENTDKTGYHGGFVGKISLGTKVNVSDCYSLGFVGNKGQKGVYGAIVDADGKDVSKEKDANGTQNNNTHVFTKGQVYCYNTGDKCGATIKCDGSDLAVCKATIKKALVDTLKTKPFKGMSFEFNEQGHIIIAHITEWDDPNTKLDVLQELSIPMSVIADSITFDRVFSGKNSTIMLPFDIAPSNITNASGEIVRFNAVPTLNYDDTEGKWKASAETETGVVEAHKPYLITQTPKDSIHFHGPVTLRKIEKIKNPNSKTKGDSIQVNEYVASTNDPDWALVGTYKTMLTTSKSDTATSEYEKESNLGRIYGFVGTNVKENEDDENYTFSIGQFAKAGHNVRTREMRAYLIYTGTQIAVNPAPSLNGVTKFAPLAIAIDDLPNAIEINVTNKPIIEGEQITTFTKIVNVIKIEVPEESCDAEKCEDDITTISKPFLAPLKANRVDRWQDAMGRRLKNKPTKHGAYFKNGIPVIIK